MEIILLERVANLGNLGDIVKVKPGYARNFLLPKRKAKRATAENLKEFEQLRAQLEQKQAEILANAQARHEKINGVVIAVAAKAGVDGKLFGSVTADDIVAAAKKDDIELKRSEVELPNGPLKTIGNFPIRLRLHHDVVSEITVNVVSEA